MALLQISEPGQSTAPQQHRRAIGIDLGTTHSLVATVRNSIATVLPDEHGRNLLPLATGAQTGPVHEWLFWDANEGRQAVRNGKWKLVSNQGKVELFDLDADIGEKRNLAAAHPDEVARLQTALDGWRKQNPPGVRRRGGE